MRGMGEIGLWATVLAAFLTLAALAGCGDTTNNYLPEHPSDVPAAKPAPAAPVVPAEPVVPRVEPDPCVGGKREKGGERCED